MAPVQQLFGRSCNVVEEMSGRKCYYTDNNLNNAFIPSSSSGREASRYQICARVIANDTMLGRLISKLPARTTTADRESVSQAIEIFYPELSSTGQLVEELLYMDKVAAYNRETVANRWRLIFLALCESPGWQVFSD